MDELSPTSATDQSSFQVPKRIRVSQACEQCRSKKGKCDGQQPACSVCRSLNISCSYNPHPKKRGLRPGHYALLERRAVLAELITAYLFKCVPDAEVRLASFFEFEDPSLPFLASEGSKQAELIRHLEDWRTSAAGSWLSEVSARSDASIDQLSTFRSQHASSEPSSQATSGTQIDAGVSTVRRQADAKLPRTLRGEATQDGNSSNSKREIMTVPPVSTTVYEFPKNMERIFDVYFAHTHTWLPLVDKFKLMAFYHTFSSRQNMPLDKLSHDQVGSLAMLWSLIAYTALYEPEPGAKQRASVSTTYSPADAASRALSLIPVYDTSLGYEHVQALVLLSLFYLRTDNPRTSWILIGHASRINVGLASSHLGRRPSSVSRRTSVACYTMERLLAVSMEMKEQAICPQATPSLGEDWEIEAEGWEEWSSWEAFSGRTLNGNNARVLSCSREPLRGLTTLNNSARLASVLRSTQATAFPDPQKTISDDTQHEHPSLTNWIRYAEANCPFLLPHHNGEQDTITSPHLFHLHGIIWATRASFHSRERPLSSEISPLSSDRQEARAVASKILELATNYQKLHPMHAAPLGLVTALTVSQKLVDKADELHDLLYRMWRATIRCSGSGEGPKMTMMPSLPIPGATHAVQVRSETQEHGVTVNSSSNMMTEQHSSGWHMPTSSRDITTEAVVSHQALHGQAQGFDDAQMLQAPARVNQAMGGVISMSMNHQPPENMIDPTSLSARELTQLDAAVWYAHSFHSPSAPQERLISAENESTSDTYHCFETC
jgi:hypothetical protein